jgi:hypothetical protein
VVRDCEATGVGIGFAVRGQHNLITRNHAHDLAMVVNTQGGDDDYGAVGVWLFNSGNEVSYNRMIRCIAPSHDYGVDGGVVEFYGDVHDCSVHHNWGEECDGGLEVGGGSAHDNVMAYNVLVNNGGMGGFHLGGAFGSDVRNFRFENNTVVETGGAQQRYVVVWFNQGDPAADTFLMRNNIVYVDRFSFVADKTGFTHENNLYTLLDPSSQLGFPPGAGEIIADPLFADAAGADFHLQDTSPAINAGADLGHSLDFDDRPVPAGAAPDIGAYEHQAADTTPPAAPQNLQVQAP